jgi:hypothetical protein
MEPRRNVQRRHLIYYLRVFNRENDQLLGHLVDITPDGLMIISENPCHPGDIYKLRMGLPKEIFGRDEIEFEAECKWSRRDVNPSFFDTGFRFQELDREDVRLIADLVVQYGFRD